MMKSKRHEVYAIGRRDGKDCLSPTPLDLPDARLTQSPVDDSYAVPSFPCLVSPTEDLDAN